MAWVIFRFAMTGKTFAPLKWGSSSVERARLAASHPVSCGASELSRQFNSREYCSHENYVGHIFAPSVKARKCIPYHSENVSSEIREIRVAKFGKYKPRNSEK